MAGNNSIQFLRGTSSQRASCTETSLAGQPIYETDTSKLYVGDGETSVNDLDAVKASAADEAETADNVKDQNKGAGIKIWIGTQAEFEDLSETDEDTIYYITDIVSALDNISTAVGQIVTQGWHTIVELPRLNGASGLVVVKKLYQSNEPISVVFAYSQTGYGKPVITLLSCQMPAAFTGYKIGADTSNTKIQIYLPTTVADNEWSIAVFNAQSGGAIAVANDEVDTDTSTRDTEIELAADIGLATTGTIYQQGAPVLVGDQSAIFEADGTTVKKAKDYSAGGTIEEKFDEIDQRLNNLGFKQGSIVNFIPYTTLKKQARYAILSIGEQTIQSNAWSERRYTEPDGSDTAYVTQKYIQGSLLDETFQPAASPTDIAIPLLVSYKWGDMPELPMDTMARLNITGNTIKIYIETRAIGGSSYPDMTVSGAATLYSTQIGYEIKSNGTPI